MPKKKLVQLSIISLLIIFILTTRLINTSNTPEILKPLSEEIHKLEIQGLDISVNAHLLNSVWVLGDRSYPADQGSLIRMVDTVKSIRTDHLISRKEDAERYELTADKALIVKVYSNDEPLRVLRIGKESESGRGVYFSVEGVPGIFLSLENLRSTFSKTEADLRNKQMLSLTLAEITSLTVEGPGLRYTLFKDSSQGGSAWSIQDLNLPLDQSRVEQYVSQLVRINAISFPEETSLTGRNPSWRFNLKTQGKSYILDLFDPSGEDNTAYPMLVSESPYPFNVSKYKAEELMKEPEVFLGN